MTIDASAQRFLAHDWCTAARAFDNPRSLKASWSGSYGQGIYCHQVDDKGIKWAAPGEPHTTTKMPHLITWAELSEHYASQPKSARLAFKRALDATDAEARRNWDAMHAISPNGYSDTRPEIHEQLDAERKQHYVDAARLGAVAKAATLILLPLSSDEPADLIEWAAVLDA